MKPTEGNYGVGVGQKLQILASFLWYKTGFHKCTQSISKVFIHIEYF